MKKISSAEYVSKGHPDKLADLISDLVLDEYLKRDSSAHVACETLISNKLVVLAGEISSNIQGISYRDIVKRVLTECGYSDIKSGFDVNEFQLLINLNAQSEDIYYTVNNSYEYRHGEAKYIEDRMGAGDQGIVIGYACNETKELMPLPQMIAKSYIEEIESLRENRILEYLQPVCKALVTMNYEGKKPSFIENIVLSVQHTEKVPIEEIQHDIMSKVINNGKFTHWVKESTKVLINPSGKFCVGGPMADTGVTGRKLIIDAYGGRARHGGGALSGKDPSKVDRTGAYLARWIAKHIVGLGYAQECEIELHYAIGVAAPINLSIECFGTENIDIEKIKKKIYENFDMRLYSVIKELELLRPNYYSIAKRGQFGVDKDCKWEKIVKSF